MAARVGILGAGQLGFLLCRAARRLQLATVVLAEREEDPANRAADRVLVGSLDDPSIAERLIESVDVVTFDKEAIPAPLLARLERARRARELTVRPGLEVLRLLQNKSLQKDWLSRSGLPTLPFESFGGDEPDLAERVARLGLPCVQKMQQGGYDGRGVQLIHDAAGLASLWRAPSLVEPCLTDMTEIAVVLARGAGGEIRCYPPVTMEFDPALNALSSISSPAGIAAETAAEARRIASRAVELLEGVGVFAVEMFLTDGGELLINEISPRVHNAGHHTLDASDTCQFEQHLRAITGMPLGPVGTTRPAVMRNLLYEPALAPLCKHGPGRLPETVPGVHAWWYGKQEARPGRKMGHVTAVGYDFDVAFGQIERALARLTIDGEDAA